MTTEKLGAVLIRILLLVPAGLILYYSFNAGGFFPRTVALGVIISAQALILFVSLSTNPFARLTWPAVACGSGLALFALWIMASQLWSDAPIRSLLEFDRAMLYLLVLLLCIFIGGTPERLRFALRGVAAAIAAVGIAALITRVLPDVWPTPTQYQNNRLGWPLTYANALALQLAFGIVLCAHLTASAREPRIVRVLAAAVIPALATTLYFTFSRGPMWTGLIGLLAYLVVGRPRALLSAVIATLPPTAVALVVAYDADLLATPTPTTAAAQHQGHRVAVVVAVCMVVAGAARAALLVLDQRRRRTLVQQMAPAVRRGVAVAGLVVVAAGAIVAISQGAIGNALDAISHDTEPNSQDFRKRLTSASPSGRLEYFHAALKAADKNLLHGTGAGSFELSWQQYRRIDFRIVDAHSLYVETLSEMGIIGLLLILSVVVTPLATALLRARPPNRTVYAAVFGAGLTWVIGAGLDWDWEMPATTIPFIALAGLALGSVRREPVPVPSADTRLAMGFGGLLCLIAPILIIGSQSRLTDGVFAYNSTGCKPAMTGVADSLKWLAVRTEAYQVMGYCDLRLEQPVAALQAMRKAHYYDPHNWETDAGLAVAQAANGEDPRAAIDRAVVRAPRVQVLRTVRRQLDGKKKQDWINAAGDAHITLLDSGELSIQNPY